jgi:hypothetical protein
MILEDINCEPVLCDKPAHLFVAINRLDQGD